ncbi:MAG: hypothetical protein DMG91_04765, partial [Acidobacteria bacterium]
MQILDAPLPLKLIDPNTAGQASLQQNFRAHVGKISRESGFFLAGSLFTTAAGYFFRIFLARTLGAEALGIYALGMTIVGFL